MEKNNSDTLWIRTCDHVNAKIHLLITVTVATDCAIKISARPGIREDIILCYRLFSIDLSMVTTYYQYSINLSGYCITIFISFFCYLITI